MREYEEGATAREAAQTVAAMRHQDGGCPASQWVRLGAVLDNLLARLRRDMSERAITKP